MKTFSTIKEAFKNGFGDVFFTKNNQYICESRHSDFANVINNGFVMLNYQQVVDIANSQKIEEKIESITKVYPPKQTVKMVNSVCITTSYYDEYPDAYGQHL